MILIRTIFYGIIIGGLMLIPGVSGGTIAIYLGIYDHIIDCIANFKINIKNNVIFLCKLLIGATLSVIILSGIINRILIFCENQICIIIGVVFIYISIIKIIKIKLFSKPKYIALTTLGLISPAIILFIPQYFFNITTLWQLFIAAFILSIALILPGISISYCLFIFGLYQRVLDSITHFDIIFLSVFIIGLFCGILVFTKLINYMIKKNNYSDGFNCYINGFVLFSSLEIIPFKYLINNSDSIFYILISLLILFLIKNISQKQGV